jgi:hypothetical protein
MEKAFTIQLAPYAPLLKRLQLRYREDGNSLWVGPSQPEGPFAIFVSCRTLDTLRLLEQVLPVLRAAGCPFRLIRDQAAQFRLNAGAFGDGEAGKVLSIYPQTLQAALRLAAVLGEHSAAFKGPVVADAIKISENVYIQAVSRLSSGEIQLSLPLRRRFPFPVPKAYRPQKRWGGFLGRYYLPVQVLRASAKGNIYKAISLRNFAFEWCLIKQGNPVALDDYFDRDMKDRLRWQRDVLHHLQDRLCTPAVTDFFEQQNCTYLVMQYVEGEMLGRLVRDQLNGRTWRKLLVGEQVELLKWYAEAVELVAQVHAAGYVHRDVTDSNFIVLRDGRLCILDFELSYSIRQGQPAPPFLLGTFGYVAPEQIAHALPDVKEDVYSLGALLCFVLTGCPPLEFIAPNRKTVHAKLIRLTGSTSLAALALQCLSEKRNDRPGTNELKNKITRHLAGLNQRSHEKNGMDH